MKTTSLALYFLLTLACQAKSEIVHPMPQLQVQELQALNALSELKTGATTAVGAAEGKQLLEIRGPRRLGRARSHSETGYFRELNSHREVTKVENAKRMAFAHRGGSAGGGGGGVGGIGGRNVGGGASEARPHPKKNDAMSLTLTRTSILPLIFAYGIVLSLLGF